MRSPRTCTYRATMCPWCEHSPISSWSPAIPSAFGSRSVAPAPLGPSLAAPSPFRATHRKSCTLELTPARSLPLNAFRLYTAPFTSFSATSTKASRTTLNTSTRPREGSTSSGAANAVPTTKYEFGSSANSHEMTAPSFSFSRSAYACLVSNVSASNKRTKCSSPELELFSRCVSTAKVFVAGWCAILRGCSPSGTARTCSFWMSSTPPITRSASEHSASESGNAAQSNGEACATSGTFTLEKTNLPLLP
mmetsp:Transcript_5292/g.21376  ORF Transcript_5292/g.21376 Transcript_5292/m.21376 type:complete len:250 (-) Transcript_5292:2365-3114(-)